jgi:2-polyprenyl-3-methyl-5-hydroxy-6-metoxy-1,4-benzoquinol methylase
MTTKTAGVPSRTGEEIAAPGVRLEDRPCPLGCAPNDVLVIRAGDRLHGLPGTFSVVCCRTCGLMRTNPRPTPDTIGVYYPDDYVPYQTTRIAAEGVADSGGALRRIKRTARRFLLDYRTESLPPLPPGRMLEIGCASGSFLHRMANQNWLVEGIEFSEQAAAAARAMGYRVFSGSLEDAPEADIPFDLVVGWMVLEHLHEPVLALQKLRRWTRPGGWLALSVPNAASLEFALFRDCWFALQLPTHTYHYTPQTLRRVLEAGGWQMERLLHQRNLTNLLRSAGTRLQQRPTTVSLGRRLVRLTHSGPHLHKILYPAACAAAAFGQTGRMTVWARRGDD